MGLRVYVHVCMYSKCADGSKAARLQGGQQGALQENMS